MADWNLECEIKIRNLETLKENLDKERKPLSISEFAEKVNVSYGTIYERVRTGVIKAKIDNRTIRIPYSEYENYMQRI